MLEIHKVLVYKADDQHEGEDYFVAHSELIDQLAVGNSREKAVRSLGEVIECLREVIEEEPDLEYERRGGGEVFRNFRRKFNEDPTQYASRFGLYDNNTWLWIYDVDSEGNPLS